MNNIPLKWAGSKHWLTKLLKPLIEREIDVKDGVLVEPFAGACGFFLSSGFQRAVLNDNNAALMHFYRELKHSSDNFNFDVWPNGEADYYDVRDRYNQQLRDANYDTWLANALIYLNVYGFNGLYRTSASTGFNVPFGNIQSLPDSKLDNLAATHKRLGDVTFTTGCFRTVDISSDASLVYADPPYARTFTKYTDDFNQQDQLDLVSKLSGISCRVIASNSIKDDEVISAYRDSGFRLYKVQRRRMISQSKDNRANEFELVAFKNWTTKRIAQVVQSDKLTLL
jgi:DNA adenine methylase